MAFDKTRFGGVVAPIVNPCGEDASLDRGALEANLTRLLATDVAGLYINGGTGDAANLTQDERLETAADTVRAALRIIGRSIRLAAGRVPTDRRRLPAPSISPADAGHRQKPFAPARPNGINLSTTSKPDG